MLSCVIFAVASVVAFCNGVNINVLISWDIVRAENVRKNYLKTISSYSVCVIFVLPCFCVHLTIVRKKAHEDKKIKSVWLQLKSQLEDQKIVVVPILLFMFVSFSFFFGPTSCLVTWHKCPKCSSLDFVTTTLRTATGFFTWLILKPSGGQRKHQAAFFTKILMN